MTATLSTTQTVREIALAQPSSIRIFEYFGIDYCCGGRQPLAVACASRNISLDSVLAALAAARSLGQPGEQVTQKDWSAAPLSALCEHITATHHAYVLRELPRLAVLAQKVVNRHGDTQAELPAIQNLLARLDAELTPHLTKEETILFPYIGQLEVAVTQTALPPAGCMASATRPIAVLCAEHEAAGALLAQIRELSNAYTTPPGACPTYLAYYTGLHEFEQDLHQHIHLENNILFPRALALEAWLQPELIALHG